MKERKSKYQFYRMTGGKVKKFGGVGGVNVVGVGAGDGTENGDGVGAVVGHIGS